MQKVRIEALSRWDQMLALEDLQAEVWSGSEAEIVPAHMLLTIALNGGVLLGGFDGERLIGFVMGFVGVDPRSPNRVAMARLKHASHMLGVLPEYRDRGVGLQLKLAQRRIVLNQGIRLISWTYDPLQSRNAYLNIRKLGALSRTYLPDHYGSLRDNLNRGLATDRFMVEWWITSSRVETRIEGSRKPLDMAHILAAGAVKANSVSLNDQNLPVPDGMLDGLDGNLVVVEIPSEFNELRSQDPDLADQWRAHSRRLFLRAFEAGYIVTDFVYFKEERLPRSYYLLSHGEGQLG